MALITDLNALDDLVRYYLRQPAFVFDVETLGDERDNPHVAPVAWISMATEGRTDVIPMAHPHGELEWEGRALLKSGETKIANGRTRDQLRPSDFSRTQMERRWHPAPYQLGRGLVFQALYPLFMNEYTIKIGHNVKYDLHAVRKYLGGEHPAPPYYDTLLSSWILDVGLRKRGMLGLDDCVKKELGIEMKKGIGKRIEDHAFSAVAEYSHKDAELTWQLYKALEAKHTRRTHLLLDLEHAVLAPVIEMEATGVRMDTDVLREIDGEIRVAMENLQGGVWNLAGHHFNLKSNRDKQEVLFGERKLKPLKRTAGSAEIPKEDLDIYDYAVDQDTLDRHKSDPLVKLLIAYTAKTKLHGTYILPYLGGTQEIIDGQGRSKPKFIKSKLRDGRIYCQFTQNGAESGRFASKNPNLQNVPARMAEGQKIRSAFVPDEDHVFVQADYSQIEPRIIASLSGDPTMLRTYLDGGDVYMTVAERMGVSRFVGKTLVLSISYGVGATKISDRIGCSMKEAKELGDFFKRRFPRIEQHKSKVVAQARIDKYSETIWGRRRYLPRISSRDEGERSSAMRQAYNHRIQGCLPADTTVLTRDGWLPIGDFEDGTEVWTGERWAPAIRVFRGEDTRIKLHLNDGRSYDCDTRHKLLVQDGVWPRWASMNEIVGLPLVRDNAIDWGVKDGDPEDWYWLGRMIGDGHTSKTTSHNPYVWTLAFGPNEGEDRDRFVAWLRRNPDWFVGVTNSKQGFHVGPKQITGGTKAGWAYWTSRGVIGGSRGKRIPAAVFSQDYERRNSFLEGYVDADGHYGTRSTKITSVNRPLLEDTLRLMQTLGQHGCISKPMINGQGAVWYDLYLHRTPTVLSVETVETLTSEPMYTLSVDDERHAFSSEGLISKNTAADIMKFALVNIHHAKPEDVRMLLTVHDEVVLTAPVGIADEVAAIVKREMEAAKPKAITVPLVADVKIIQNWGEAKA